MGAASFPPRAKGRRSIGREDTPPTAILVLSGGGVVFARPACLLFGWKVTGEDEQRRALVVMALVAAVRRKSHQPLRRQDAALQF